MGSRASGGRHGLTRSGFSDTVAAMRESGFLARLFFVLALALATVPRAFSETDANATSSIKPITQGQRVFTCGNSFHAWYIAPILKDMAEKAGLAGHEVVGVSKIGGSRAIQHWEVPDEKNEAKAALRAGKVDVLTLACMHKPDEGIDKFTELALAHNPNIRVTLQEFWMPWDKNEWPFTGNPDSVDFDAATSAGLRALHEPYFKEMDAHVAAVNARVGKQVLFAVPVGQAILALREKIMAGQMPGVERQSELFTDKLGHPQPPLEALAAYCHFAVIYRRTPVGLPMPAVLAQAGDSKWRNERLNRELQEIAWSAVTQHPLTGLAARKDVSSLSPVSTRRMTMDGQVFVGYQGWFTPFRPEDGAKWVHYGHKGEFKPGFVSVEMWPDTSDLDEDEKVPTDFRHEDGSVATVFDPQNPKTVNRHFAWMKQYGIDGAFLQRFVNPAASSRLRPHLDRVLAHVRAASRTNDMAWGMMYDLTGVDAKGIFPKVSEDWKRLAGELKIREDEHYIHHRGKPVVVLWGIGFNDNRPAPGEYLSLVQFLKNDPVYGGNTVIVGVPFYWRTGRNDAVDDPALKEVILAADVIAPWPVGRYANPEGAVRLAKTERAPDTEWAAANGRDYLPGIFPGFSWFNLMKTRGQNHRFNQIPRLGGQFLWTQAVSAKQAGATMLYVAMFDEIDEATAIFKVSNNPPAGESPFVTYDGLPSDHYLWLTGQIGRMLRGEIPASDEMPRR